MKKHTGKIADGRIADGRIADGRIADGKIADGRIADGKIADGKIADGRIADGRIADGKIAVVTGASRGVGKGIALGLAMHGATVYITGRTESDDNLPGFLKGTTIQNTAEEANRLGGAGIAYRCDFSKDEDINALFARIQSDHGRLDILVNNAWAGASHVVNGYFWNTPFWKQPIAMLDDFYSVGLRSGYLCSQYAADIMSQQGHGMIVNISYHCARQYIINPVHGIIKAAVDKMTADTAHELKERGVKVFSLYPGSVATEGMREIARHDASIKVSEMESPLYAGMCVAALAADGGAISRSGEVMLTSEVAERYGFTDMA